MNLLKKLATITLMYATLLGLTAGSVFASGDNSASKSGQVRIVEEKVCTTAYGGGTVCEVVKKEVHEPVETGVAETAMIASGLFAAGYVVLATANRFTNNSL